MKASFLTKETILDVDVVDRGFPRLKAGDHVVIDQLVREGSKERIQKFEGDVIAMHRNGIATTFTVRKVTKDGFGVERIFPYYSPSVKDVHLVREGIVRRAKLFYLRDRTGKSARIKPKIIKGGAKKKTR
ncbi:50S ribosomal protein L19 [bacterium]|nr:50S ribosomal protein L19 [bacterium]